MDTSALQGLAIINGKDIWTEYGAFLTEEKRGARENLTAILAPSKTKGHVAVNIREADGCKYSDKLEVKNEERDLTLHFALFAPSRAQWLQRYRSFISDLKQGINGWLDIDFPGLGLELRVFYVDSSSFKPLTYLWEEGMHASRFKVKFREPVPSF